MITLRNCQFKFKCPKQWDSLERTNRTDVRFCDHCKEKVYFCHTSHELREAIEKNYCVAINKPRGKNNDDDSPMLGLVELL